MIDVRKLNNQLITINAELIQSIEETPDTTITLTTGKVIVVKEKRREVIDKVIAYKQQLYCFLKEN